MSDGDHPISVLSASLVKLSFLGTSTIQPFVCGEIRLMFLPIFFVFFCFSLLSKCHALLTRKIYFGFLLSSVSCGEILSFCASMEFIQSRYGSFLSFVCIWLLWFVYVGFCLLGLYFFP
ncbi:hypothetical protein AMTRI_Chr01g133990 [Amborella trichopoda]